MADVKSYWESQAKDRTLSSVKVTHSDIWQRWLEIAHIKTFLGPEERVLDIGCGTGYATKIFADNVAEIIGIDYSDAMIERAKSEGPITPNAHFYADDVLQLHRDMFGSFDTAISVRCLINLTDWTAQKEAISNIAAVLEPGGKYIFVEGWAEGRAKLDQVREDVGLSRMPPVWHNHDFYYAPLSDYLSDIFEIENEIYFGTYDFISRVVHPLVVAPNTPKYDAKINEIAANLALRDQGHQDISRTLFLVLKKK